MGGQIKMICNICGNVDVEKYKLKNGKGKQIHISWIGFHCHNCGHIASAMVEKSSAEGIFTAELTAHERFIRTPSNARI